MPFRQSKIANSFFMGILLLLIMTACDSTATPGTATPVTISPTLAVPTIGFAPSHPQIGDKLTIKGSGFPPKGQILIVAELTGVGEGTVYVTGDRLRLNAVTDEAGKFTSDVTLDKWVNGKPYQVDSKLRFTISTVEKDPAIELGTTITVGQASAK